MSGLRINRIRQKDRKNRYRAMKFAADHIPSVAYEGIVMEEEMLVSLRNFFGGVSARFRVGAKYPDPIWIGAWEDNQLVGIIHATSHMGQTVRLASRLQSGDLDIENLPWLGQFVRECSLIEEIAVLASHRGLGLGSQLLEEAHRLLLADPERSAHSISAYATSGRAAEFFRSNGYHIGKPRTPLPPEYAAGLRTMWDPSIDDGGMLAYRQLN